jgi:triosephosphate isomerase (TIM)
MRTPIAAGNWKMNMTVEQARTLVADLGRPLADIPGVEKVLCPPFTALLAVRAMLAGLEIGLGAQDMHWEDKGAFTGAVSPLMVGELCSHVIIGHSERRAYFGETDETVNKKVRAAQKHGITPIVCVGETLSEYEAGVTGDVVGRQVRGGLAGIEPGFASSLILAYEPVWAIGTGRASSGGNAQFVHSRVIRPSLAELFGQEAAQAIRILYGGSVTGSNAAEFFAEPDIDGALVGGASLKKEEFLAIAGAAARH